jgi:hypothetical protein
VVGALPIEEKFVLVLFAGAILRVSSQVRPLGDPRRRRSGAREEARRRRQGEQGESMVLGVGTMGFNGNFLY